MENQTKPNESANERGRIPALCVSFIQKLQREAEQAPTYGDNKNATENALIRYTRNLGWATWVIAFVGILSFGAALLQWNALRNTDSATHDLAKAAADSTVAIQGQLDIMQRQLDQMKIAADSAKQSSDATLALERPYLFLNIIKFVQPNGPTDSTPYVDYSFINVGRVPGVLKLVDVECLILKELPPVPEFHQNKFHRADNAIGSGAIAGSNTAPVVLPKCDFAEPITDEIYNELRSGQKFIFFQALILYNGALDFSYSRMVGSRYDFSTSTFYDVGLIYNREDQEKGAVRPPVSAPGTPQMKVIP